MEALGPLASSHSHYNRHRRRHCNRIYSCEMEALGPLAVAASDILTSFG